MSCINSCPALILVDRGAERVGSLPLACNSGFGAVGPHDSIGELCGHMVAQ
jgi:hypothetical protein